MVNWSHTTQVFPNPPGNTVLLLGMAKGESLESNQQQSRHFTGELCRDENISEVTGGKPQRASCAHAGTSHPRDPLTCWVSSARAGRGTGTFSSLAPIMDCSASSSTCREPQSCWHSWTHHSCQPQPAWHCFMSLTQLWGFLPASLGKALLRLLQFCSELLYCNMHECLNQQSSVHYSDCPFSIHQLGQSIHSHLPLRDVSHSYS